MMPAQTPQGIQMRDPDASSTRKTLEARGLAAWRFDMPFIDTRELPSKAPLPGWEGRFLHSENMTFAYYEVTAGASIHEHAHPNEEVWHVIEGELEVTIDGETRVAGPGCVALVPPDTSHAVRALSQGRVIVVDHPRRHAVGGVASD